MADLINLPHGVRCLFTIDGLSKVTDLDGLKDGDSYVCARFGFIFSSVLILEITTFVFVVFKTR